MIESAAALAAGMQVDRSAAGRVRVSGPDAQDLLHRMVTADVASLTPGLGTPSFLLERSGRVVDRVIVAHRGDNFLLLGNSGRGVAVAAWVDRYVIADDVTVTDITPSTVQFTLVGDRVANTLQDAFGIAAGGLGPWESQSRKRGDGRLTVVRAEEVGAPSYHLVAPVAAAQEVRRAIASIPAGDLDAYDVLCLAGGLPRFGPEYDERTLALEAGMPDAIHLEKGCFLGQEVIARLYHQNRVKRCLVRLRVEGDTAPVAGSAVLAGAAEIGRITGAAAWEGASIAFASVDARAELDDVRVRPDDGTERRATLLESRGGVRT